MWRRALIEGEELCWWDEGQRSRRYFREPPQASRVAASAAGARRAPLPPHVVASFWSFGANDRPPMPRMAAAAGPRVDPSARDRALFGLPPGFAPEDLRRAYRRLVSELDCHPDHGGDEQIMTAVNLAYHRLLEPL